MGARLFVGNLSSNTTEAHLGGVFSEEGREVKQVKVVTDRETGHLEGSPSSSWRATLPPSRRWMLSMAVRFKAVRSP